MPEDSLFDDILKPQPLLVLISGPSGVGKDSVVKALLRRQLPLHFVVTTTDRAPRSDEKEGVDYFFVSKQQFEEFIARDEMLEYAVVYGHYKGIRKTQIREALSSGKDVIVRLDVQGVKRVKSLCQGAVTIFIVPSNSEEWFLRLKNRNTETSEDFQLRMETARYELQQLPEYEYVVVNARDRLEETVNVIEAIIKTEHHRVHPRGITL
jgi:guanylate kinase